jgi:hypothetical protein
MTLTLGPCLLAAEQYVGTATDHTCLLRLGETEMVNLGISIKPKVQLYLAYARCGRSVRERDRLAPCLRLTTQLWPLQAGRLLIFHNCYLGSSTRPNRCLPGRSGR